MEKAREEREDDEEHGADAAAVLFGETFDKNFKVNAYNFNEKHKEMLA